MKQIPFSAVRNLYDQHQPHGHWFDKATIRFFRTELPQYAFEAAGARYFVTAETNPSGMRKFSVRKQDTTTGEIDTVGDFHSYNNRREATAAIKHLAKTGATQ